jgi:hypothetical protein
MQKYVAFAGASDGKKSVTFLHDQRMKYAPATAIDWSDIAADWLKNNSLGVYLIDYNNQQIIAIVEGEYNGN